MKKIVIIMLIVLLFSISSCKFNGNDNNDNNNNSNSNNNGSETNNYTFIEREKIENELNIYYAEVSLENADKTKNTFIISENNGYFYYYFKSNKLLIDKDDNLIYSIDDDKKTKTLERQLLFDRDKNKNVLIDLFAEHIENVDGKYIKTENVSVGKFNCDLYEKKITIDAKNYVKYLYYVDKNTGYCMKSDLETCVSGEVIRSAWEVISFVVIENNVNDFINPMIQYTKDIAPLEFNIWPDMGLALLIPKYSSGDFSFGIDDDTNATLSIDNTRLAHVKDYVSSLKNYGFVDGKDSTNEASQYIYVTYNSDNVMVKIIFSATVYNLTIKITKSTPEEINKELSKL